MAFELARVKLRGIYAVIAGGVLLFVVPLYQALVLNPTGYANAIQAAVRHADFGPLLAWTAGQPGAALAYRIVELVPFLLVVTVPGALRRVLWPRESRIGLLTQLAGQVGFASYAVALVVGLLASNSAAAAYASATSDAARAATAASYAASHTATTLLSTVIGGLLVAVYLLTVGVRIVRIRLLPRWLGYGGVLVAAALAGAAFQFAATPAETALSSLSVAGLALWLLCLGVVLARLSALPNMSPEQGAVPPSANQDTRAGENHR